MNKRIIQQIYRHQQAIDNICVKRIQYLESWIKEHQSFEYGARYWTKCEEYQKEIKDLQAMRDESIRIAQLDLENYKLKNRIKDLEWLLNLCYNKQTGYGEFEVIQKQIKRYLDNI